MKVLQNTNINDAYFRGVTWLSIHGVTETSRAGDVIVAPTPVTNVYSKPTERVLFDVDRDANPFFHLYECIWMMAGMSEATLLDHFVSDFSKRFAESDGMQHGAYGYRWMHHFGYDQLRMVVSKLRENHKNRRVVIQMWDAGGDLEQFDTLKDVPCNTQIYLRINDGALDITVTCRSNDAIWGAYGSNVVHFSFLQEVLAGAIGVPVGKYYQISNNFHMYTSSAKSPTPPDENVPYPGTTQLFTAGMSIQSFVSDCECFVEIHDDENESMNSSENTDVYEHDWFRNVAVPMFTAHNIWKNGDKATALNKVLNDVKAPDWRRACAEWMTRRLAK